MAQTSTPVRPVVEGSPARARRAPLAGARRAAAGLTPARRAAVGRYALLLLPGVLTVYFSFNAGGFFAGAPAVGAIALALALVLWITLAERPFAAMSVPWAVAVAALAMYAVWTLVSANWSGAPARALVEFDRALLYLLAVTLFGLVPRTAGGMRWMLGGLALAIVAVCTSGFVTRAMPDVWPITLTKSPDRLSYPLTYWNSLGLLAAVGMVFCFHFASSERASRVARVLGAAAAPVLAATLLLTFSRGAMAAGAVGLVAYVLLARPRGLLGGLLTFLPAAAVAGVGAYRADALAAKDPTGPLAVAQGHDLALLVAGCALAAALARIVLLVVDARLERLHLPERLRRPAGVALVVAVVAASVGASAVLGVPDRVRDSYARFVEDDIVVPEGDLRDRLADTGNNGRIKHWRVALIGYREDPLMGSGAGTFQLQWARHRASSFTVVDAHSLYLEVLGELGLVGLAFLGVSLATLLGGAAARARRPERAVYAAVAGAGLAWALAAGVDWHWEMPAGTLWLFAVGGAALATAAGATRPGLVPSRTMRVALALGVLVLAVTPARMAISQMRLNESVAAFKRGDCARAIDAGLGSLAMLSERPEPYEIIGYCDIRSGYERLGVRALQRAVTRDPGNWEFRYGLALVRGASGLDPRRDARAALRRNREEPLTRYAVRRFRTDDPNRWRQRALTLPLPVR